MKKRKPIHKMLAFLLSVTMLPVVFPLKNAQAATSTLMTVDFEDYEVGVICEATDTTGTVETTFGDNIYYKLFPGDKLEIAEENGNKYLKFTRVNSETANSYVMYKFPEKYSEGKVSVSFDYRPENHSQHFVRFAALIGGSLGFGTNWDSSRNSIQRIVSYGNDIYTDNNTGGSTYYVGGINKKANYETYECAVVTQTIDFTKTTDNYTFNAKFRTSAGDYKDIKTITRTPAYSQYATDISGIAWAVKTHATATYNGKDTGDSVYRIDNITVSVDGLNVADSNVENEGEISANEAVEITFDEAISDDFAQHISIYKDDVLSSNENYTLNLSDDKTVLTVSGFEYASAYSIKIAKTLKTQDETRAMIDDYVLAFTTNSIISHNITRSKYETGYTPEISPLGNINYTYSISKDGGAYEEYALEPLNEFGEYSLKIVATDENGKEQTAIIEFQIVGAVAPEIKDIGIDYNGTLDAGTELIGEYTYFDENDNADENKDYCTFQWYRSDKQASGYTPISGATGEKYVLTEADQNKYIRFGVKPFSKVAPTEGEEYLTEPFASFMTPEATNISISGKMAVGEELIVNYDYFDLNGDEEITSGTNATAVVWKISDTSDGEYTEVGSGRNYTLKDTDINKWLKVEVIPKNNGGGRQSGAFSSYIVKIIEASSDDLFTEDFESYDVGVIYEATDYTRANTGKIHYELYSGDKVEIAEENGNKYLKFTRAAENSNSSYVMYEFPEAYDEGILSVSYDYKPEAHSQCFGRFGTLISSANGVGKNWASGKPVIQQIISYAKNIYVHSGTNADYYVGGINNIANYSSNECATVTQTIDFTKTSNNYTFNAQYKNSGTNIGTAQRTVTASDVNAIAWALYRHGTASWNGPDSGASVYRIDNIKAIAEGMSVEKLVFADEDCVEITFDEALSDNASEYISVFKDGEELLDGAYTVSLSNDKKSVLIYGIDYATAYRISISSDLESVSGKKLIGGFETEFKTISIISHSINREKYSIGYIPSLNLLRGIDYTMHISKDGAEYQEYNLEALEETGKYKLKVVATDANSKSQTMVMGFEIVDEIEPEISDIFIKATDTLDIGTVLQGEAVYFDINDEIPDANKDYCLFQWYRSESEYGNYTPIDGADAESYTLTAEDEDKYIRLGVKPVSKVEPKEGEEYLSEPFVSFMNPAVTNVSIMGKMATNEKLTVDYIYSDMNEDEEITEGENATVVIWYTSDSSEGGYTEVGRGRNYTIKEEDSDKWFKVAVIPKNNGGGKQDKQFLSKPVVGAFSPTAIDVKINGNLNVGSTIGVDYRFYDANNDSESGSVIEWYVGGKLVSTDDHYTISSNDAGKSVYVSVTPKSSVEPATGEAVKSESKTINKKANTVSSGGGGGSSASKPTTNVNPPASTQTPETSKGFRDISGHWAEASILKMVKKGIIYGKSDTEFAPEDKITRAEFAALISRMLNLSGSEYEFNDVDKNSWYAQSISAVATAGFMSGFEGDFRPMDNITREEMAVVISAIAAQKEIKYEEKDIVFADEENISDWAKEAVSAAAKLGIIQGMDDNKFVPKGDASRAQTVVMLARLQDVSGE